MIVHYLVPATGKKVSFIKIGPNWYKCVKGAPKGKPIPACRLIDALENGLRQKSDPDATHFFIA